MSAKEEIYLPFKAVNVYMQPDYRKSVVEYLLTHIKKLKANDKARLIAAIKKYVKVNGFRNPTLAPLSLKVNAYTQAFEKESSLVRITLELWVLLQKKLQTNVKSFLQTKKWKCLSMDREILDDEEAFLPKWPKSQTSEKVFKAFKKVFPDFKTNQDDVSLMTIWISGHLPTE